LPDKIITAIIKKQMANNKRTLYVGGLADEVDEKVLQEAFNPFGETLVQIPLDYVTGTRQIIRI